MDEVNKSVTVEVGCLGNNRHKDFYIKRKLQNYGLFLNKIDD